MADSPREWRVGELARATRVTVRALHHYDRLGLLVPSARTAGGHRCYTGEDVRRLHVILALRGFGLSLAEIRDTLAEASGDPVGLLRRQLAEVEERIRRGISLRSRLHGVLGALDRMAEPSTSEFLQLIEEMVTMSEPLTPEQLAEMQRQRSEWAATLSPDELAEMSRRRSQALAALSPEQLAEMQAQRARHLPQSG
ncbi:DNA-binding transcriptional MerR regulator [Actinoplanes octamycinicus]|uniref:DNA-binding transcriptional MerR regulator n=1 Tax=Actinoplanes octamycinicus TaxID=135948 RepID=A0A7W7H2M7_9ACTN|nr:MerR family transcriptional regulator [Actinoplanes octamycinicus]MBB4742552.1 DNA-binding transcriptional MerR regulator [Actinoplanes octamycinicus]GIE60889.1 transcriptional regulator [Actinoplanes octamycinicus]